MVKIQTDDRKITNKTFLATLTKEDEDGKLLYPNGIHVGVERVVGPKNNTDFNNKPQVQLTVVLSILDPLKHGILGFEYNENGEKVQREIEGELVDKMITYSEDEADEVAFYFKIRNGKVEHEDENIKCTIYNLSSAFPLINTAFLESGFKNPQNKNIECTTDEIIEVLEGLEFMAGAEWDSFKGGRKYRKLIVKSTEIPKENE